jgi:hypothetical protein
MDKLADEREKAVRFVGEMVIRRKLAGALYAILGLMLWAGVAEATTAGTVIGVSGSCTDQGRVLTRGDAVQVSETINVPKDGHLQLRLTDGSVISVAPGSSVTVTSYNVGAGGRLVKLSLTQGLLRAVVTPVRDPSLFEVSTEAGTASVRSGSADWFVTAKPDSAQVGVLDGTVELKSAETGRSVLIPSHWGTRAQMGLDPVPPRRWAQREFNTVIRRAECWRSGDHRYSPS